jgi:hypothetical protein
MDLIVGMQFASQVYGPDTPDSKAIYLPGPRDILLQREAPVCTS